MLTGSEIKKQIKRKNIIITDFNENQLNPNSYNLRLNNILTTYKDGILDYKIKNQTINTIISEDGFLLEPGILYLGSTKETTCTKKYIPIINGRSSLGRLGVFIHVTAGFGDIGFNGKWTLEIMCIHPVKIYPDMEICQICFHKPIGKICKLYSGKYQGDKFARSSLGYKDYIRSLKI